MFVLQTWNFDEFWPFITPFCLELHGNIFPDEPITAPVAKTIFEVLDLKDMRHELLKVEQLTPFETFGSLLRGSNGPHLRHKRCRKGQPR